ncbi:MAG: subclass B3 metallo-beta-lactamase [Gammaproteobacteria bacterium]|nr:subclass B3 metallo-beta-lactamase [Gammaproteobacteria bacterium]
MNLRRIASLGFLFSVAACGPKELQPDASIECDQCDGWNQPQAAFRIHGNTWYVGTDGLSSILIEGDEGLILIDGGLPQSAELIDANIRSLGFDTQDVAAILVSHVHFDHVGGVAALQGLSGANVFTSTAGSGPLSSGTLAEDDPQYIADSDQSSFPAVRRVVAVGDGEIVSVGSVDVKAVYTPGHTPGGVTWTWQSCAMNTCYDVVYADSMSSVSAEDFRFGSSGVADDLIASAGVIADLECDIFLSPHPFFFGMYSKLEQRDTGNPFVNSVGCMLYAETSLGWLERRLEAERQ